MQNGFVSPRTEYILPRLKQLINVFQKDLVIATQFINKDGGPYDRIMLWQRLKQAPETNVLEFVAAKSKFIIEKNIYSGYVAETKRIFADNGIKEVYIAGIDTDCCVLKTAIDLFEQNIRPVVLADYCASNGGDVSHKAALTVLERNIGKKQIYVGEYN